MSDENNKLLGKISDDVTDIKVILAKQEESLSYHIKRTDLLEEKVEILKDEVTKSKSVKEFLLFVAKISPLIGAFIIAAKKFF